MKDLDTLTITEKGQAQFPASWRKQAGLIYGGLCDVRMLAAILSITRSGLWNLSGGLHFQSRGFRQLCLTDV